MKIVVNELCVIETTKSILVHVSATCTTSRRRRIMYVRNPKFEHSIILNLKRQTPQEPFSNSTIIDLLYRIQTTYIAKNCINIEINFGICIDDKWQLSIKWWKCQMLLDMFKICNLRVYSREMMPYILNLSSIEILLIILF